jgi:hypothetical protein
MFSHRVGGGRDRFERFVREFKRFFGDLRMSRTAEGKVREKCDDENPIFPGFFLKHFTLDPRGFDLRSFLRSNCSFFSMKTREMKIDFCRRGKDREARAKLPEDCAVRQAHTFPSAAVHRPTGESSQFTLAKSPRKFRGFYSTDEIDYDSERGRA